MSGVKSFPDRKAWLLRAISAERGGVDVLNREFVEDYAEFTGAKYRPSMWGAGWCSLLSSDLRQLTRRRLLRKQPIGLSGGSWQPGFPKWVNNYRLSGIGLEALATLTTTPESN